MTEWSVRLEIDAPISTEQALELSDAIHDHAAIVSGGDSRDFGIRLSVEADTAARAVQRATQIIVAAMRPLGLPIARVVESQAVTMERLVADNRGVQGDIYVGISDIARAHGFTRQRAHELTRLSGFPAPIARTSAGRIWRFTDVERFLARPRPVGRPRSATHRGT